MLGRWPNWFRSSPGFEGCLIIKNHGPVLASQMPERFHAHLKVPDRDYALLFERLEKKVEDLNLQNAHLATFDLGHPGYALDSTLAWCNEWEWQMSKIIREPLLRWRADILKKETA